MLPRYGYLLGMLHLHMQTFKPKDQNQLISFCSNKSMLSYAAWAFDLLHLCWEYICIACNNEAICSFLDRFQERLACIQSFLWYNTPLHTLGQDSERPSLTVLFDLLHIVRPWWRLNHRYFLKSRLHRRCQITDKLEMLFGHGLSAGAQAPSVTRSKVHRTTHILDTARVQHIDGHSLLLLLISQATHEGFEKNKGSGHL